MQENFSIPIDVHPFFINNFSNMLENDDDLRPLYHSLININKFNTIKFNIKDLVDLRCYLSKYLYSINELLLSFNAVLLKKYIKKESAIVGNNDWKKIFEKGNQKNKITYLLSNLFLHDNDNHYYLEVIHKFYFYESLFRHQLSHGWIDIFPHIFDDSFKISIKLSNIIFDKNNNVKNFLFDSDSLSLDLLRKTLKEDYYFNLLDYDKNFTFDDIIPMNVEILNENNSIFIRELVKSIFLDYSEPNKIRIEELNSFIPVSEEDKSVNKFFENYYKQKIEENHIEEYQFSLNKLIEDMYFTLIRI